MLKPSFVLEEMDIKLKTNFVATNFIYYEEANSTNEELLKDPSIKEHGSVLFANNQVKGRGRLDREWISEKNHSLTFSILLTENISAKTINLINLAASIAVAQSIENLYQLFLPRGRASFCGLTHKASYRKPHLLKMHIRSSSTVLWDMCHH